MIVGLVCLELQCKPNFYFFLRTRLNLLRKDTVKAPECDRGVENSLQTAAQTESKLPANATHTQHTPIHITSQHHAYTHTQYKCTIVHRWQQTLPATFAHTACKQAYCSNNSSRAMGKPYLDWRHTCQSPQPETFQNHISTKACTKYEGAANSFPSRSAQVKPSRKHRFSVCDIHTERGGNKNLTCQECNSAL